MTEEQPDWDIIRRGKGQGEKKALSRESEGGTGLDLGNEAHRTPTVLT